MNTFKWKDHILVLPENESPTGYICSHCRGQLLFFNIIDVFINLKP